MPPFFYLLAGSLGSQRRGLKVGGKKSRLTSAKADGADYEVRMDKERLEGFKRALETVANQLKVALEAGKDNTAIVSLEDPIGRLSRVDALQSQEISLGMKAGMRQRYEMVQRALDAISKGTYGMCVNCKEPIAEERLLAIPETPLCVKCSL
jgi:DnaK suppressor protein